MKKWIYLVIALIVFWGTFRERNSVKNFPNEHHAIVAFGDSLTAGSGAPKGSSYPDYLGELLGWPVMNLGLSGELAVHAPERLKDVLVYQPYMVLIEFGANDFMQQRSTKDAVTAVQQIVEAVQQAGAIAVIIDTGGPGMGGYTKAYRKLAKEKKALFVPGILGGIFTKRDLKSDSVHPNAQGYKIVAERVHKVIKKYVK